MGNPRYTLNKSRNSPFSALLRYLPPSLPPPISAQNKPSCLCAGTSCGSETSRTTLNVSSGKTTTARCRLQGAVSATASAMTQPRSKALLVTSSAIDAGFQVLISTLLLPGSGMCILRVIQECVSLGGFAPVVRFGAKAIVHGGKKIADVAEKKVQQIGQGSTPFLILAHLVQR